ncbi:unnamed protein product [Urochloa humidicola]
MASVELECGGIGGVPDQARTFAELLRLVLPVVRSHGILSRLAAAPEEIYADDDDEHAPLIPTSAHVPPPATSPAPPPAPAATPSTGQASSTSSSRWWPFGRVRDAAPATATAPSAGQASSTSSSRWWPFGRVRDAAPATATAPSAGQASSTSSSRWWPFGRVRDAAPASATATAPPPATAPAPSASQASSTSSSRWWPFGRAGNAAPRDLGGASDIELGLQSAFPHLPSPQATSSGPGWRSGHAGEALRNWTRQHRRVQANTGFSTVVSAGTAPGQGMKTDWMKKFKGLLLAYVFFVLPLVLLFFPRYSKDQNHHVLQSLVDNSEVTPEKVVVLVLFVIHVTVGLLSVLLAHIADGPKSTKAVGVLTLWIVLSVLAFVDYILVKTLPDELSYQLMFVAHFFVMGAVICCLWFVFVWPSSCCKGDTRDGRSA